MMPHAMMYHQTSDAPRREVRTSTYGRIWRYAFYSDGDNVAYHESAFSSDVGDVVSNWILARQVPPLAALTNPDHWREIKK